MVPDMSGLAILILIVMGVLVFANFLLPFMAGVITGIVSSKSTIGHGAFIGLVVGGVAGVWNALVIIGDLQSGGSSVAMWLVTVSIPVATIASVAIVLRGR